MTATRRLMWPVMALAGVITTALIGLFLQLDTTQAAGEDMSALRQAVSPLLASGQSRGYQALLQRKRPQGTLFVALSDREGHNLAVWPPPLSAAHWSILSGPLQAGRQSLIELLGREQRVALVYQGESVGQLQLYRVQGLLSLNLPAWLFLICLSLAASGLWGLRRSQRDSTLTRLQPSHTTAPAQATWLLSLGQSMDEAKLGLLQIDGQERVQFINRQAQQLSGWAAVEARGLPLGSVLRPQSDGPDKALLDLLPPTSTGQRAHFTLRGRDNTSVPLEVSRLPLLDAAVDGNLLLLRDIRNEQEQLASLRQDARLAAATLDLMNDGLAITDRYGRITRANRKLQQLSGYSAQELQGMTVAKLMPVPFLNDASVQLSHYLPDQAGHKPPVVAWRKDASTFAVDLQVQALAAAEQGYLLLLGDKAQQQRSRMLAGRLSVLLQHMPVSMLLVDAQTGYCNGASPQALQLLGYARDQLQRMSLSHLLPDWADGDWQRQVEALKASPTNAVGSAVRVRLADGRQIHAQLRLALSQDEEPPVLLVFISPD